MLTRRFLTIAALIAGPTPVVAQSSPEFWPEPIAFDLEAFNAQTIQTGALVAETTVPAGLCSTKTYFCPAFADWADDPKPQSALYVKLGSKRRGDFIQRPRGIRFGRRGIGGGGRRGNYNNAGFLQRLRISVGWRF